MASHSRNNFSQLSRVLLQSPLVLALSAVRAVRHGIWRSAPLVALQTLRARERNRAVTLAIGFSAWKEQPIRNLLPDRAVIFVDSRLALRWALHILRPRKPHCIIWSFKDEDLGIPADVLARLDIERVEDGFVRSLGRGLDHSLPWSLCIDPIGAHYDASRPALLETLCNSLDAETFKAAEAQAVATMRLLLSAGATKYSPVAIEEPAPAWSHEPNAVLVLGQVENDKSITRNFNAISTNGSLLARAIAENPCSRVYFKQHPDCIGARRRPGFVDLTGFRDVREVDHAASMVHALNMVDTVYTISSLGGFEALLRGKRVVTFGAPFYAGWGLTKDHVAFPRRRRSLSLLELFYVAYMVYPTYMNPATGERLTLAGMLHHFLRQAGELSVPQTRELAANTGNLL